MQRRAQAKDQFIVALRSKVLKTRETQVLEQPNNQAKEKKEFSFSCRRRAVTAVHPTQKRKNKIYLTFLLLDLLLFYLLSSSDSRRTSALY